MSIELVQYNWIYVIFRGFLYQPLDKTSKAFFCPGLATVSLDFPCGNIDAGNQRLGSIAFVLERSGNGFAC